MARDAEGGTMPLTQVAPGVFVDATKHRSELPAGRKRLLLDEAGYNAIGLSVATCKRHTTIRRLQESGFIKIAWVAPRIGLLDLDSWDEHVRQVEADPWFWEDAGRLDRYRGTY